MDGYDQIWAPDSNLQSTNKMDCLTKKKVPLDMLIKGGPAEEQKISKEEENTFILQVWKLYIVVLDCGFTSDG